MARPVGANADETRERLLAAATQHFSARGQDATSLREVAADAGVSLATIHHYFGAKQQLFEAALQWQLDGLAAELAPLRAALVDLRRRLRAADISRPDARPIVAGLVRAGFRAISPHRAALRFVMRPVVERGALDGGWRDQALRPFLSETTRLVARALGGDAREVALSVQSLTALGVRYALCTDEELVWVAGVAEPTAPVSERMIAEARRTIEEHLVRVASRFLPGD